MRNMLLACLVIFYGQYAATLDTPSRRAAKKTASEPRGHRQSTPHTDPPVVLAGIDAPEKRQAFGNVSKQSLVEQVAGRSVAVEWVKTDKYGRKLGKVLLAGQDANLMQIKRGLAWHYKQYLREQSPADQQSYAAAEIEARAAKLGLWRDADPLPPWEFRHSK